MFGLDKNGAYIASVVATYWFVSINMVYLNKMLMSNKEVSIPAPLFVTWFQCIVTSLICWVAGNIGKNVRKSDYQRVDQGEGEGAIEKPSFWAQFPEADYKVGTGQRVLPLSVVFVGMITFNNLCLKLVEVSFYNVARSLTIVFNVVLSNVLLGSNTSGKTMLCLSLVILGFFMGSKGEMNFSMQGTIAGICSSLFVSLNSIYTKKILPVVENDHWRLTFYNNVNASAMFIPLIVVFEHQAIAAAFGAQFFSSLFWGAMIVAGFFGFSIGIVTVLQIKATSPLTHNISGTAKAAVQSMMAFYIWGNQATLFGVLGIFTVLGGSLLYTFVKMEENKGASKAAATAKAPPSKSDEGDVEIGGKKPSDDIKRRS